MQVSRDGAIWTPQTLSILDTGCGPAVLWPLSSAELFFEVPRVNPRRFGTANGGRMLSWGSIGVVRFRDEKNRPLTVRDVPVYFAEQLDQPLIGLELVSAVFDMSGPAHASWQATPTALPTSMHLLSDLIS